MIKNLISRYHFHLSSRDYRVSAAFSAAAFIFSILVSYYAIGYATRTASNAVTDIVLSNIPIYNVDGVFVYGTLIFIAFVTLLCIYHPRRIPFILYSLSVFWFIRSLFTMLTHIGPFPVQTPFDLSVNLGSFVLRFFTGNDLFFSAHTGVPFLLALLFWQERALRYIFLACSVFFGVIVLMGHYHYSIDVLSAFFITYSIYHLCAWLFPREQELFRQEL
jgi:hypothetical protein